MTEAIVLIVFSLTLTLLFLAFRDWARFKHRRWPVTLLLMQALVTAALVAFLGSRYGSQAINVHIRRVLFDALSNVLSLGAGSAIAFILFQTIKAHTNAIRTIGALGLSGIVMLGFLFALAAPRLPDLFSWKFSGIEVPAGFAVEIFVQREITNPTSLLFGPDGHLYVSGLNGTIWRIEDHDTDGRADVIRVFASGFPNLIGLAFSGDQLFASWEGTVSLLMDRDNDGVADRVEHIVEGLPARLYSFHQNNGIAFGLDGSLYITLGSSSDHGPELDPQTGSILKARADGSDLQVYATGLRNPYDLVFTPDGNLFATDNGADYVDPPPPDELNHIVEGGHYGFPSLSEGGLGSQAPLQPLTHFPPHSAPAGIVYYISTHFPDNYHSSFFIALFGSYIGDQEIPSRIVQVQLTQSQSGYDTHRAQDFSTGYRRAVDLSVGPNGDLFVADFDTGIIYRIYHKLRQYPENRT